MKTKLITNKADAVALRDGRYGAVWETGKAGPGLSFAHAEVDVGKTLPEHFHARMGEIYNIISGTGIMYLNGEAHRVHPGDTISLPPGTCHGLTNDGTEPVRIVVATSPCYSCADDVEIKAMTERPVENYDWAQQFRDIYNHAVLTYRGGVFELDKVLSADQAAFLASIGCSPRELFDYIEDYIQVGEPHFEDVLLVAMVRREYFLTVQNRTPSPRTVSAGNLPPREAQLGGIAWLPRIMAKARAKLRGELSAGVMYGCVGDRPFLKRAKIHAADFLRLVWTADGDDEPILQAVTHSPACSAS